MSNVWLSGVLLISIALTATGCTKKVPTPPPGSANMTTEQVMQSNPQLKQQVTNRLKDQIEHSNLPPEEKKRQIDKLMKDGPPK